MHATTQFMSRYKISDLEKLSGIKAHTIRIWEQRYTILSPLRTETNIRYYDDAQLTKLLNVVSLMKSGVKISAISKLTAEEINARVESLTNIGDVGIKEETLINQLLSAGLSYDEASFEKTFSSSILSFGLMDAYQKVFYPMLIKIGLLWTTARLSPAQEHFVTNLIRQKIFAAIDALAPPSDLSENWLLFLPEGEQHDLGLLIANYGLRASGKKVIYLGPNVPLENLYSIAKQVEPSHYLTFSVSSNDHESINEYLASMNKKFKNPPIHICCSNYTADNLKLSSNQKIIANFQEYLDLIGV
ncbi:MAG: DNA-binding transcriptional MerR regulator [Candidatus Azotimanducaceae bacterium]